MYWVKRWLIWIYRWRHCRGFGVQSPTDYSFIRYVINEHYPYYAYKDLAEKFPHLNHLLRKKTELLLGSSQTTTLIGGRCKDGDVKAEPY